jgi:hypothetical protein
MEKDAELLEALTAEWDALPEAGPVAPAAGIAHRAGACCLRLHRFPEAEMWMGRALELDPRNPEPALQLALHFRWRGDAFKCLHYCDLADRAKKGSETARILYERSIATYYAAASASPVAGARTCMAFLDAELAHNGGRPGGGWAMIVSNLRHYMQPLAAHGLLAPVAVPEVERLCPESRRPSSISVLRVGGRAWANVRCVNYRLADDDRFLQDDAKLRTCNLLAELADTQFPPALVSPRRWGDPAEIPLADFADRSYALGLEDVRLFEEPQAVRLFEEPQAVRLFEEPQELVPAAGLQMSFVAAQQQYSPASRIRQLYGRLQSSDGGASWRVASVAVLEPPDPSTPCEKNWIPVPGPGGAETWWIYSWHPLRICRASPHRLITAEEHPTPALWRLFRGSTVPVSGIVPGELWLVVHFKFDGGRLHYAHAVIVLDAATRRPLRTSVPFYLARGSTVEYCIGLLPTDSACQPRLTFFFSTRDGAPQTVTIPRQSLSWVDASQPVPLQPATAFVTCLYAIYPDLSFRNEAPLADRFAQLVAALPASARLHVFCDSASARGLALPPNARLHVVELDDLQTTRAILGRNGTPPSLPPHRNERKDTLNYMLLMNAKSEFMNLARASDSPLDPPPGPLQSPAGPAAPPCTSYVWLDAGIAKLPGVQTELPFFLDAVRRSPAARSYDVLVAGMQPPISAGSDQAASPEEIARLATASIRWRFAGGIVSMTASSTQAWFDRSLETIGWLLDRTGILPWEVNVWAAMEARGQLDEAPCRMKWAGCATHDVGMLQTVARHWNS